MLKIAFLVLMIAGVPVAIAMAAASLLYVMFGTQTPAFVVIQRMVSGIDSFPLLAVPFFILAGNLMNNAGITNRIYSFALALVGWLKGGLGHVNVVGSVIFAGMSGTAIGDAAGLGTIEIKAMREHGYSAEFAVGVTAASATKSITRPVSTTGCAGRPAFTTSAQIASGQAITTASSISARASLLPENLMSPPQPLRCAK